MASMSDLGVVKRVVNVFPNYKSSIFLAEYGRKRYFCIDFYNY